MITIRNDFHGTAARLRASIGDTLTPSQVKRCRKALCGIEGCTCGGALSERGPQRDSNGWVNGAIHRNQKWEPIPAAELLWNGEPISEEKAMNLIE